MVEIESATTVPAIHGTAVLSQLTYDTTRVLHGCTVPTGP